jgi:hypothetical protein
MIDPEVEEWGDATDDLGGVAEDERHGGSSRGAAPPFKVAARRSVGQQLLQEFRGMPNRDASSLPCIMS